MATLTQMYTELTSGPQARFTSDWTTTTAYRWINQRYARVWRAAPWPWRLAFNQSLSVTGGTQTVSLPSDFMTPLAMFDADGQQITFLPAVDFMRVYNDPNVGRGTPVHYTVAGATIYLGPTPSASATFKFSYLKRLQRYVSGVATTGPLTSSTDVPILGYSTTHDDWHWLLTVGALAEGIKETQGPAEHWQPLDAQFEQGLADMVEELGTAESIEAEQQYGLRVWGDSYAAGEQAWR